MTVQYRFQPLKVAECHTEEGPKIFYLSAWGETLSTYFYFWYLEGGGKRVLVDTGFSIEEGRRFMPTLVQEEAWRPENRLGQIGVDPRSIDSIIVTHLHFDHFSSSLDRFPQAEIYLQEKEYETALRPSHPWFNAFYVPQLVERLEGDLRHRLRLVAGDREVLPGLRVVFSGGHTPGHQSVYVQTAGGLTCLTGDLCFYYRNLQDDHPIGLFSSLEEVYSSMERFRRECDVVLPNHDPILEARYPISART